MQLERSTQRELQHLGLATVCAVVYAKITGEIPNPREPGEMQAILSDVAHAVSNLVVIYAPDPATGVPEPLGPLDLIEGKFLRGAQVFRSKRGEEMRGLTIRRCDMANAIKVLQSAQITFRKPGA